MDILIVPIVIVIVVLLLMREVSLWYFRINEIVSNQKKELEYQDNILNLLCGIALKQGVDKAFFPSNRNKEENNVTV